jgi:hypothetical protein
MRVQTGAKVFRTGQVFLVRKVILEFSAWLSGRANVSIRTGSVRVLLVDVQTVS